MLGTGAAVFLLFAVATAAPLVHLCDHDAHVASEPLTGYSPQSRIPQEGPGRRLASSTAPIRLYADTSQLVTSVNFTAAQLSVLSSSLLPTAIGNISMMLAPTNPLTTPLTASRSCNSYWTSGPNIGVCTGYSTSLPVCGSQPSITVPLNYVGLSYTTCSDYSNVPGSCTLIQNGSGIANTDFLVFVTAIQTSRCPNQGQSGVLAYASPCQRDQTDRPVIGTINFCPFSVPSTVNDPNYNVLFYTTIHEMFHALGFTSSSWALFRNATTGAPLTPRDPTFPNTAASSYSVSFQCSGTGVLSVSVPGPNVITNGTTPRGYSCTVNSDPLNCAHFLSTPKVLQSAIDFFNCSSLQGGELENQELTCSLLGSHWEERILETEIMAPVVGSNKIHISPMTLATFEDSGWYTANYSMTGSYIPGMVWGYKQGCNFATQKCISASFQSTGNPPHFLNTTTTGTEGCMIDMRNKGYSDLYLTTTQQSAPLQYPVPTATAEYLTSSLTQRDYCPSMGLVTDGDCTYANTSVQSGNPMGETFGSSSFCFAGTLLSNSFVQDNIVRGKCLLVSCTSTSKYTVTLSTGATIVCTSAGQAGTASGFSGYITCPDPAMVCRTPDPPYSPPWLVTPSSSPSLSAAVSVSRSLSPSSSPASASQSSSPATPLASATPSPASASPSPASATPSPASASASATASKGSASASASPSAASASLTPASATASPASMSGSASPSPATITPSASKGSPSASGSPSAGTASPSPASASGTPASVSASPASASPSAGSASPSPQSISPSPASASVSPNSMSVSPSKSSGTVSASPSAGSASPTPASLSASATASLGSASASASKASSTVSASVSPATASASAASVSASAVSLSASQASASASVGSDSASPSPSPASLSPSPASASVSAGSASASPASASASPASASMSPASASASPASVTASPASASPSAGSASKSPASVTSTPASASASAASPSVSVGTVTASPSKATGSASVSPATVTPSQSPASASQSLGSATASKAATPLTASQSPGSASQTPGSASVSPGSLSASAGSSTASASASLASPTPSSSPTRSPSVSAQSNVNCVTTSTYSSWSACVGPPCSTSGTQSRTLGVTSYPQGAGTACSLSTILQTQSCVTNYTPPCSTCADGIQNNGESGVDCGGTSTCKRCDQGLRCTVNSDCATGLQCGANSTCISSLLTGYIYYVNASMTLNGVYPGQFSGSATSSFVSAVATQLSAVTGFIVPLSSVSVTSVSQVSSSTVAVSFVVGVVSRAQGSAVAAALSASTSGFIARVVVSLASAAPAISSASLASSVTVVAASDAPLGPILPPTTVWKGLYTGLIVAAVLIVVIVSVVVAVLCCCKRSKSSNMRTIAQVNPASSFSPVSPAARTVELQSWKGTVNPIPVTSARAPPAVKPFQ